MASESEPWSSRDSEAREVTSGSTHPEVEEPQEGHAEEGMAGAARRGLWGPPYRGSGVRPGRDVRGIPGMVGGD